MLKFFYALPILFVLGVFGYLISHRTAPEHHSATPFAHAELKGLTANLFTGGDQLRATGNELFIEFRDAQSNLVDVGEPTFNLELRMPNLVMHSIGKVLRTPTAGRYRTTVEPQMAGQWIAHLGFHGTRGEAETNFPVSVK